MTWEHVLEHEFMHIDVKSMHGGAVASLRSNEQKKKGKMNAVGGGGVQ